MQQQQRVALASEYSVSGDKVSVIEVVCAGAPATTLAEVTHSTQMSRLREQSTRKKIENKNTHSTRTAHAQHTHSTRTRTAHAQQHTHSTRTAHAQHTPSTRPAHAQHTHSTRTAHAQH
jgi:hypothetical protein